MRYFQQKFNVHPVGQGLFYSGKVDIHLNGQNEVFRFVYDCGSLTSDAGEEEVDRYRLEDFKEDSDRLGLLVISHFDADHINHIKRLLAEKRKVDNLVMPFMDFAERFFLVLRFLENNKGKGSDDDFGIIRLMLNPLGELAPHIDGDDGATVYLITSDPDTPAGSEEGQSSRSDLAPDTPETAFSFKNKDEKTDVADKLTFNLQIPTAISDAKLRKVKDSITGDLHFRNSPPTQLMEFIFYRREASGDEKAFYQTVFEFFCKRQKINPNDPLLIDRLVDALRKIKGATQIKSCYKEAKKVHPKIKITGRDILNMNTTALCLLHKNLPVVFNIFSNQQDADDHDFDFQSHRVQKIGGDVFRVHESHIWRRFRFRRRFHHPLSDFHRYPEQILPNVLLTSDAYFKTQEEVDRFLIKYNKYLNQYWLLQVPHHGSSNNADRLLFTRIPHHVSKFINYGTKHRFESKYRHPDAELISELLASGHGHDVIAVTEHTGLISYFGGL